MPKYLNDERTVVDSLTAIHLTDGVRHGTLDTDGNMVITPSDFYSMHQGNHYFIKGVLNFTSIDTEFVFAFDTGFPKRIRARAQLYADIQFLAEIYEGATISIDGTSTPVVSYNNDRDSLNKPQLQAYTGFNIIDYGERFWFSRLGGGFFRSGVSQKFNYEVIAKSNTTYIWRLQKISSGTGYVDYNFYWCEH